jgi:hypothetical protein
VPLPAPLPAPPLRSALFLMSWCTSWCSRGQAGTPFCTRRRLHIYRQGQPNRYDHHRPRSAPASTTAKRRSICTANTSGASAPLPRAMIATESMPPGAVAR